MLFDLLPLPRSPMVSHPFSTRRTWPGPLHTAHHGGMLPVRRLADSSVHQGWLPRSGLVRSGTKRRSVTREWSLGVKQGGREGGREREKERKEDTPSPGKTHGQKPKKATYQRPEGAGSPLVTIFEGGGGGGVLLQEMVANATRGTGFCLSFSFRGRMCC